jgi:predicted phage-related endonuclease
MAVTGFPFFDVAVLIGGQRFFTKRVLADLRLIPMLVERETIFWTEHILKRFPPTPTALKADSDALKALYPVAEEREVDLSDDEAIVELVEARIGYKNELAEAEAAIDLIDNRIKALMGSAGRARVGRFVAKWPTIHGERIDLKALRESYPEIATEVAASFEYRRFTIKEVGDE